MSVSAGVIHLPLHPSGKHIVCFSCFFPATFGLVLLEKIPLHALLCFTTKCESVFFAALPKNVRKGFFCCIALNPQFLPSSLCHLLFLTFSPPSRGFPNHTTTPLTDAALTDLLPSSFHWPPAWQLRFNAAFSLARTRQVNLWVHCDLMPPAFEVSYSSVAYRTQKRCQVAIVKSYPWRGVVLKYNSPDVMREDTHRRNGAMCDNGENVRCLSKNALSGLQKYQKYQKVHHVCDRACLHASSPI